MWMSVSHLSASYHQRHRRSVDFHDSISLGPQVLANGNEEGRNMFIPQPVRVSKASGLTASLMVLLLSVLPLRALLI
ncbi:hypothetical protein AALO_G00088530 [Alosa alosa]|uniref:Uncharacterized protein n=1 Tax=Alosa alosa TaxID=278164 RepID=A0AAV6H3R4_9TELE|nr:hypothetical protein AALO_G00088530 [Alosa alosa]